MKERRETTVVRRYSGADLLHELQLPPEAEVWVAWADYGGEKQRVRIPQKAIGPGSPPELYVMYKEPTQ